MLIITPELRELILLNETASTIKEQAQKEGYMTMSQWGEKLVNDKVTSMSEVMRVSI